MRMQQRTHAIVLKKVAYGDSDWIVTLFSRDLGRLGGFAKSARVSKRRFGGALEPGTLVELKYVEKRGAELVRMEDAAVLRPVTGVMKSIEKINAMSRALELSLGFLQERQAAPEKFDVLNDYIAWLNQNDPRAWDTLVFEFRWLSLCGFRPSFSGCAVCGRAVDGGGRWSFDLDHGGVLCASCLGMGRARIDLTGKTLKGLRNLSDGACGEDAECAAAAGRVLGRYVGHILGRPMKCGIGGF